METIAIAKINSNDQQPGVAGKERVDVAETAGMLPLAAFRPASTPLQEGWVLSASSDASNDIIEILVAVAASVGAASTRTNERLVSQS